MTGHIRVGGAWKDVDSVSVRVGGAWKTVDKGFTRIGGVWKEWFSSAAFYLGIFVGSGTQQGISVAVDGSGNSFHYVQNAPNLLFKTDPNGVITDQKRIYRDGNTTANELATDVRVASSGNIYVLKRGLNAGVGDVGMKLIKYNSSFAEQWERRLYGSSSGTPYGLALDSSENSYHVQYTNIGSNRPHLAKYNSSGTLQWQRRHDAISIWYDVEVVSDGVVIVGYWDPQSIGGSWSVVLKYNTSGALQWSTVRGSTTRGAQSLKITSDSSGNIYIAGTYLGAKLEGYLAKYNSSGVFQWQKRVSGSSSSYFYDVACDSAGNVYCVGRDDNTKNGIIAKFNTSGTLQWQRYLADWSGGTSTNVYLKAITIDSSDSLFISGSFTADNGVVSAVYAKLKNDGSITGNFAFTTAATVTMRIDASSLTVNNADLGSTGYAVTQTNSSLSNNTLGQQTIDNASLSSEVKEV